MNNAIKTLSGTHLQLRTKRSVQKTSSSTYWKIKRFLKVWPCWP